MTSGRLLKECAGFRPYLTLARREEGKDHGAGHRGIGRHRQHALVDERALDFGVGVQNLGSPEGRVCVGRVMRVAGKNRVGGVEADSNLAIAEHKRLALLDRDLVELPVAIRDAVVTVGGQDRYDAVHVVEIAPATIARNRVEVAARIEVADGRRDGNVRSFPGGRCCEGESSRKSCECQCQGDLETRGVGPSRRAAWRLLSRHSRHLRSLSLVTIRSGISGLVIAEGPKESLSSGAWTRG